LMKFETENLQASRQLKRFYKVNLLRLGGGRKHCPLHKLISCQLWNLIMILSSTILYHTVLDWLWERCSWVLSSLTD
jgi:hypothetical protein